MKAIVRPPLLVLAFTAAMAVGWLTAAEPGNPTAPGKATSGRRLYRGEWRDLAKEAAAMEIRAARAVKAKYQAAAFHAFHKLAFLESDQQRFGPMLRAAESAVSFSEPWFAAGSRPDGVSYRDRIFHLESRGLVEKGLTIQGRLAEGQAQLRRMRAELTALHVAEHGGTAESVSALTELDRWQERSLFMLWQVNLREAVYLDRTGQGNEALPLLRAAIDAARKSRTGEQIDAFYEIQLAPELAGQLRDLGYASQAIAVLEEFVREWDGSKEQFAEQYWGARVQLAMFRSEFEGPSEALLREAEDAHQRRAEAFGGGRDHWSAGVVAFLRHRLRPSPESVAELRRISTEMKNDGEILHSLSSRADALLAANDFAKPGHEQDFIDLLAEYRRIGSKSSEPALYKHYGDYLLKLGRPAEALPIYREALRQVVAFGWRVQEPRYRLAIIAALVRLGDLAAAEAEWAALDLRVAAIADLPPERALEVRTARVKWLAQRGRIAEARAALADAQSFADTHQLNAWQRRNLDGIELRAPELVAQAKAPPAEFSTLQPIRVETEVAPGDPRRARFALRNPASTARTGKLTVEGPGVRLSVSEQPRHVSGTGVIGGGSTVAVLTVVLAAGEELPVILEMSESGNGARAESDLHLFWHEEAFAAQTAEWHLRAGDDPFVTAVLNANRLQRNPFHAVSFTHQVVHREPKAVLENIRFTASAPLRLECYDAATGRLLAIDADGNGQFTDPGDVLPEDADANRALDLPFAASERLREIEVFVFPTANAGPRGQVHVDVELLTAAGWEKCARNEIE
jgi:tetratricopeptide (TPR) repeat protein